MPLFNPSGFSQAVTSRATPGNENGVAWWMQPSYLQDQTNLYRNNYQNAVYQSLGPQFQQGLSAITNNLAGAGPLADSGARMAMARQLGSQIYGQAAGQIGQGSADFLGNLLNQRMGYRYQSQLMRQQQQMNKPTAGDVAGGLIGTGIGAFTGGLGSSLGKNIVGGGY